MQEKLRKLQDVQITASCTGGTLAALSRRGMSTDSCLGDHPEDLGVDGRILKWILRIQEVKV
jgi:hypothetical protein